MNPESQTTPKPQGKDPPRARHEHSKNPRCSRCECTGAAQGDVLQPPPSLHLEELLPVSHTITTPAQGCPHGAGPLQGEGEPTRSPTGSCNGSCRKQRGETERGQPRHPPHAGRIHQHTAAEGSAHSTSKAPGGLDFTQASSNHTWARIVSEPEELLMDLFPTPINKSSA